MLAKSGLRVEHPPEDWLFKVFTDDGSMVDIIFRLGKRPVETPVLDRATDVEVLSIEMPVLSATDMLASKLAAMDEHRCDMAKVLPVARALREQVEWDTLRKEVTGNDFAQAALFLCDRLRISGNPVGA